MSRPNRHIIRRQFLDVGLTGTEADGLALQRTLPEWCHESLSAIEVTLDRCAPADKHVYIDRLEIDAGTMKLERLKHDLAGSIATALEEALKHAHYTSRDSGVDRGGAFRSARETVEAALLHFVKYGNLPWWCQLPEGQTLEQALMSAWENTTETGFHSQKAELSDALISASVRRRLVNQFSVRMVDLLCGWLSPSVKQAVDEIMRIIGRADLPLTDRHECEAQLWDCALVCVASQRTITLIDLVGDVRQRLSASGLRSLAVETLITRHWPGAVDQPVIKHARSERSSSASNESPDAEEGIYIENAGLVLLHPFVPRFFQGLGVAADDRLLKPEKALALLHFLATGRTDVPEYELVLPKVLCGLPIETVVERSEPVTTSEQEVATALLEAVVQHWSALGNSSANALRGTFVFRPGKLMRSAGHEWLLQVERRTVDILLDQLPWGISMIKLPWMTDMLWVEWS
jgi:hypothetical protein